MKNGLVNAVAVVPKRPYNSYFSRNVYKRLGGTHEYVAVDLPKGRAR